MCFALFAGTSNPMPLIEWRDDARDVTVTLLSEDEAPISANFSKPHIYYIASTSGCGCDFPYVMHQDGEWPDDGQLPEYEASERHNRERLFAVLRESGEAVIELYGIWDGNFDAPPLAREEIQLDTILRPDFRFKEQGFYVVSSEH